jgi:hypothetical protein
MADRENFNRIGPLHDRSDETPSVEGLAVPYNTPVDQVDMLVMEYPNVVLGINKARSDGYSDDEIRDHMHEKEREALFYHPRETVNKTLGRTKESIDFLARWEQSRQMGKAAEALKDEMSREEVERRFQDAGTLGISPWLLLKDDELYKKLQGEVRLREETHEAFFNEFNMEKLQSESAGIGFNTMFSGGGVYTEQSRARLKEIQNEMKQYAPPLQRPLVQRAVRSAVNFGAQRVEDSYAATPYMAAGGLLALAAGNIGPQALIPEEVVTVPAGALSA